MRADEERLDAFEARLRRLRPAAPSAEFEARLLALETRCTVQPRRGAPRLWPLWAAAAAAVALLAAAPALRRPAGQSQPAGPAAAATVAAEVVASPGAGRLVGARNEGVWRAPDGGVYRVVRCLAVNRTVLRGASADAEVELLEPRQHVLLVAMKSQ